MIPYQRYGCKNTGDAWSVVSGRWSAVMDGWSGGGCRAARGRDRRRGRRGGRVSETTEPAATGSGGKGALAEVAALALRLGFTAFGGPAVHIAMLRDEVVTRRHWITDSYFLDLLGATNLIPGPNSTEMVMHIGHVRAGWRGLIVGGVCFIMPAALIVLALAWVYVTYGTTPTAAWLLYGIKPVIIAVVLQALWGLSKTAVKGRLLAAVGL